MHFIFNGSITDSVCQDGLDRLLLYWLTGRLPAPMSAYPCGHFDSDVFRTNFPCGRPFYTVTVPHCNPHRLQRDFLLYQAGYPPRTIRVSNSNGPLGNVAVIRRPPLNSQPIAGPCLVWRGSLSGSRDGPAICIWEATPTTPRTERGDSGTRICPISPMEMNLWRKDFEQLS